jgi:transcriptional regulator with GAF, ATPase, and Fis domain
VGIKLGIGEMGRVGEMNILNFNAEDYMLNERRISREFQTALLKICRQAMETIELDDVLTLVAQQARDLFDVDFVLLAIPQTTYQEKPLCVMLGSNVNFGLVTPPEFFTKGLGGSACSSRKVIACPDYWNDYNFEHTPAIDALLRSGGVKSAMFIPFFGGGEIVALMGLCKKNIHSWSNFDLSWAEQFAQVTAPSINNARLYYRLKKANLELQDRNQELLEQKKHEQVNAMLTLVRTAAHDLSQPLTILQAELDFALLYGENPSHETLTNMHKAVELIRKYMREYQTIMRFETVEAVEGFTILDRKRSTQPLMSKLEE